MNAHNEQQGYTAADMADQAAAAFERGRESVLANPCRCIDCGGVELAHSDDCTNMAELHGTPAAPGLDLETIKGAEDFIARHSHAWNGEGAHPNTVIAGLRALIDASPKGALPALPDDFSESKDWRAGGYAERIEWLLDTVRSQRGHIDALLDSPKGSSDV